MPMLPIVNTVRACLMQWDILLYIVLGYGLLNCVIYYAADPILFPSSIASYEDERLGQNIKKLITKDGKKITAVYLPNPKAFFTLFTVPSHYDVFKLTDEPRGEALVNLEKAKKWLSVGKKINTLEPGEFWLVPGQSE